MAQSQAVRQAPRENGQSRATSGRSVNPTDWMVGWKPLFWGSALVMAANIFLVLELQFHVLSWSELGQSEFMITRSCSGPDNCVGVFTGTWCGWLIRTGRRCSESLERAKGATDSDSVVLSGVQAFRFISKPTSGKLDGHGIRPWCDTAHPTHIPMFYFFFRSRSLWP